MRYLRIEPKQSSPIEEPALKAILERLLRVAFPVANPDLEKLQSSVAYWWLEVDDLGAPQREVGFNESGAAVVVGSVGTNVGYLIDAADDWSSVHEESWEAAAAFERVWSEIWPRFRHLERDR